MYNTTCNTYFNTGTIFIHTMKLTMPIYRVY